MRQTRCYVAGPLHAGDTLSLPEGASTHLGRVLRARVNDAVTLFNGQGGEYEAQILTIDRHSVRVRIGAHVAVERESPLRLTLLQSIARGEKMDLIVQKATELGVSAIVALQAERSVVRLGDEAHRKRAEHWRAIAVSACEQCGRNRIPTIEVVADLPAALARAPSGDTRVLLEPGAQQALAEQAPRSSAMTLLIGPEGGFAPDELALAREQQFIPCRLGPRVLRAETAPLAALAVIQAVAGDLQH
ncbi:MAG TPA: 16S rRNA (uracil(1498)-N(3))-methyltransferase [Steroidobacteraceae bacterium]|nr:16S rRNA (uracil(1498)-N(3))-methyltransferase [Steroidobacteraceae bacterium]